MDNENDLINVEKSSQTWQEILCAIMGLPFLIFIFGFEEFGSFFDNGEFVWSTFSIVWVSCGGILLIGLLLFVFVVPKLDGKSKAKITYKKPVEIKEMDEDPFEKFDKNNEI